MDFKTLQKKKYILLDGAMGTMLQKRGLKIGGIPEELNITNPDIVEDVHRLYIQAGSDIVYANTFGANGYKLSHSEYSVEMLVSAGIRIAKKACKGSDCLVALDIGTIGQLLEPTGTLSFESAYAYYKEMLVAGENAGADLVVFETQTDLLELKAAVLAAKENTSLPILCTMTFEENMRTFTGVSISAMAKTMEGLGVEAIGVNCSLGPKELYTVLEEMTKWTNFPLILKANAGLPDPVTNEYNISAEEFAEESAKSAVHYVKYFGGCCGTDETFISELKKVLARTEFPQAKQKIVRPVVCSATCTVELSEPRVIGERINPTGKKRFKEALLNHDIDYILNQAVEQTEAGAEILDVNVGLPGIDEKEMMVSVLKELQGITDAPLQIDSTIPEVIEAALRVYNGKPILNSVNGEEKSLETILPLAKKYGACVIGLALDENGIPKTAQGRFEIAQRILARAQEYGIPKEDVIIDCLTLTASAEQDGVKETLSSLKRVTEELGLKTVLGVSNISFGLPNRELINHTFLIMALENGLTLPIMNPNIASMMGAFRAYKLLAGYDRDSRDYVANYAGVVMKTVSDNKNQAAAEQTQQDDSTAGKLKNALENGLKSEGSRYTSILIEEEKKDSMEIINEILIPALDKVGTEFEKGKIFLPQLILSAGVATACFDVIKNKMMKEDNAPAAKGNIVLATVKGDIHDIGKNIVKVLLENYGYNVIDLGKDVDYQKVVDAAIEYKAELVGLSALMTTTLVSMEETIKLLRENNVPAKVVVGGAVLTADYAQQIGADYYAKDARETVEIARKVIGA